MANCDDTLKARSSGSHHTKFSMQRAHDDRKSTQILLCRVHLAVRLICLVFSYYRDSINSTTFTGSRGLEVDCLRGLIHSQRQSRQLQLEAARLNLGT